MSERETRGALAAVPGRGSYWLASRHARGGMELFTFSVAGREMLPVFGHREDAEEFLRPGDSGGGWRPRETTAGEFASILMGPCAEVRWILLDPWPGADADMATGLASMERENFLELLADGGDPFRPAGQRNPSPSPVLRAIAGGKQPGRAAEPPEAQNPERRESAGGKEKECPTR